MELEGRCSSLLLTFNASYRQNPAGKGSRGRVFRSDSHSYSNTETSTAKPSQPDSLDRCDLISNQTAQLARQQWALKLPSGQEVTTSVQVTAAYPVHPHILLATSCPQPRAMQPSRVKQTTIAWLCATWQDIHTCLRGQPERPSQNIGTHAQRLPQLGRRNPDKGGARPGL